MSVQVPLLLRNQEQAAVEGLEQTISRHSESRFFWDTLYVRDVRKDLEWRILALYIVFSCYGETHKKIMSRNANSSLTVSSFVVVHAKQHGRDCL